MASSREASTARTLMFIASSALEDLQAKGVEDMLRERDEGGFFDQVVSVHPWARKTRSVMVAPNHVLEEMGHDRLPGASRSRMVRRLLAPWLVWNSVLRMRALIRGNNVTVARASDPFWTATVTWLATRGSNAKFVISIHADWKLRHALDPGSTPRILGSFSLAERLARFNISRADAVVVIRDSLRALAAEWGARETLTSVMPHVVDDHFFRTLAADDIGPPEIGRYAFFAGRVSRENYVLDLAAAFTLLPEDLDLALVVAGDGDQLEALRSWASGSPNLHRRLVLLGSLPRDEVQSWRRHAVVNLCLMGGYSLIEACASGRPVIAYDVEWHHELVVTSSTGVLVGEGSVEGVRDAVVAIASDPKLADALGERGRMLAMQRHAKSLNLARRVKVYESILVGGSNEA